MITVFNMRLSEKIIAGGWLLLVVLLASCAPAASTLNGQRPRVVATTTQVTALAKVVGGDKVELRGILQANIDPHEYEPTADDVKAFANAQLIFINGVGLEKWLDKTIQNSGTKAMLVDTSKGVKIRQGKDEDGHMVDDPHLWHSPANAILMLNNIRDALSASDTADADTFKLNAAVYEKKLIEIDAYIKTQIATIPAANRQVVSNHDTFGYYFERYGLTLVGSIIPSMDTNFQPSAKELAALVTAIKAQKVKSIFIESSLNPQLAQQIAKEAGVQVVNGALYGDTLGPPGSGADTLDGMLRINTDTIVAALR
jgi:zinc/manganese transport system substrate-binding protein/manganese/iron transport system substrate-binding protein